MFRDQAVYSNCLCSKMDFDVEYKKKIEGRDIEIKLAKIRYQ